MVEEQGVQYPQSAVFVKSAKGDNGKWIDEFAKKNPVGVKYYTVKKDYGRKKVSIIDLKYVDKNYSQSSSQFYITQQDPLDNREMLITYSEIRRYFSRNYTSKLSLEQLRQIKHIISSCN